MSKLYGRVACVALAAVAIASGSAQSSIAQTFTVPMPDVQIFDSFTDDDGPPSNSFFVDEEFIGGIPRFDPLSGSLTSIGISASFDFQYDVFLDTNGILNPGSPHQAFAESNFDFGIGFSTPQSLSSTGTEFVSWALGCTGDPTDMDGCQDFTGDFFTLDVFGSIDAEDFAHFIGQGTVGDDDSEGALVAFIARPVAAFFELNNLGGAGVELDAFISNGQVTVEYFANDGTTSETPLLPPPPGTLPPEFEGTDCEGGFCIPTMLGPEGPGVDFPLFFDPPPAIGFDYEIVTGPNIAGIQIPAGFGDDLFELLLSLDGVNFQSFGQIEADTFYDLTGQFPDGVSHMRLLGIESDAGVDSEDPQGFPTGLTFVSGGQQVGLVMTPIAVPEPTTAAMLLMGAISLAMTATRRG